MCLTIAREMEERVCVFDDSERDGGKSMCLATSTAHATTSVYSQDSQGTYICTIPKEYAIKYGNWNKQTRSNN